MPVILGNKVVDKERVIGKRRDRGGGKALGVADPKYCETAGLTLEEVINSNRMPQMNVFRGLGHPYVQLITSEISGHAAWQIT
jgi:hypothetical protein